MSDDRTFFGFEEVAAGEKAGRVREVFDSVAQSYDLMNDLMSFGLHRGWKRYCVHAMAVRSGARVLDLAGGTGDMARLLYDQVGPDGEIVVADINASMLHLGRDRLLDEGCHAGLRYVQADAQQLPMPSDYFDHVCIAFGLRNVTRIPRALAEMFRVLRPGGRLSVLEFSQPRVAALKGGYDAYSFQILPRLGRWVARDEASYRYLAESIRKHPGQDELLAMMSQAGYERSSVNNLLGGIVALHQGYKF